jgi:hypothetical protein
MIRVFCGKGIGHGQTCRFVLASFNPRPADGPDTDDLPLIWYSRWPRHGTQPLDVRKVVAAYQQGRYRISA